MNWNNKSVLITGAGGFIGSHLTEKLVEAGARTRALVHYNSTDRWGWLDESACTNDVEVVAGDIREFDSVSKAMRGVEVVFHLAALIAIPYSYESPSSYVHANIEGTLNVLQAALQGNVERMVHTSTSEVYGTAREVPIPETHALQAQSPYSATKIGADKLVESFNLSFGLPLSTVRPFNTYGPRQSARAVIPTIMTQALAGQPIRIGNISPTRDFNYVADTVNGFLANAASPSTVGRVVNLGTGKEISIGDLAKLICSVVGSESEIVEDKTRVRPGNSEVERLCADNRLARELMGWEPQVPLREGLTRTLEWLRGNMDCYRIGSYAV
ncbi:MAG TPA: SDR family NAD(P)-dependent oxidoreductase [Clostridia bacterium]|nr:SDR family NAD(P)-dependent oxidoreductase [Clostridia bacterium]